MSAVADGMNMLLETDKTTLLICVLPVAVHVYHAWDCTATNNPTPKDKMMDRICRFDVHRREREREWRTQKIFMWGGFIEWHMVIICIWCALYVTSHFDVIFMFPNQRFGEVC